MSYELPSLVDWSIKELAEPRVPERMNWSVSSMRTFRTCKRLFYWQYVMGLVPKARSTAFLIGEAIHATLEEWYRSNGAIKMRLIVNAQVAIAEEKFHSVEQFYSAKDVSTFTTACKTLMGAMLAYKGIYSSDLGFRIELVEHKFKVNLGDFDFNGRIDLVTGEYATDAVTIWDHKSASTISEHYIARLPLDSQMRGYLFGYWKQYNQFPTSICYNVIKKCKLRQKKNEAREKFDQRIFDAYASAPADYFHRENLRYSISMVRAFEHELRQTHAEYLAIRDKKNPRSWGINDDACTRYNQLCAFHSCCSTQLSRPIFLSTFIQQKPKERLTLEMPR